MTEHPDNEGKAAMPLPSFRLLTLKKRAEFKDASGGARYSTTAFTMLRRPRIAEGAETIRFGFTVTKKVGHAVERNRMRRRLREAVRAASASFPAQPMDLVILARRATMDIDFASLTADIARAVAALARKEPRQTGATGRKPASS